MNEDLPFFDSTNMHLLDALQCTGDVWEQIGIAAARMERDAGLDREQTGVFLDCIAEILLAMQQMYRENGIVLR